MIRLVHRDVIGTGPAGLLELLSMGVRIALGQRGHAARRTVVGVR
ncbi:hypothetical protein [Catenuloplanes niger]|uniref:Uncharacterized protein n=1 Tax=Catenuloplanes niger TaxID=587534 RepID=A0AAE4A1G9_9ACTN|nr:hypothetical protein [Catenuloplanes niger]MDR7327510.1 hypothetical protein [Catenuloplanes niger]